MITICPPCGPYGPGSERLAQGCTVRPGQGTPDPRYPNCKPEASPHPGRMMVSALPFRKPSLVPVGTLPPPLSSGSLVLGVPQEDLSSKARLNLAETAQACDWTHQPTSPESLSHTHLRVLWSLQQIRWAQHQLFNLRQPFLTVLYLTFDY